MNISSGLINWVLFYKKNHEWGNEDCPCLHSDPPAAGLQAGETISVSGKIWFYSGTDIEGKIESIKKQLDSFQL